MFRRKALFTLSSILALISVVTANSASVLWMYQPKVPKSLQK
ncbi:MAG: cyclic lactone autoinducer peptide [Clostridia bacterium]|nr:cyclic lactone autoinducer peptide [Clostridia bacterium]